MTAPDEATRRQHAAARPDASTWLSANAGSGKTRVLTDRVARLLLNKVQPQHILCLTYTKAAASEMQNRLFERLGAWAMLDNDPLRAALAKLGYAGQLEDEDLRRARTLFARAIETPGGLKIQTIHSFCGSLLRRFPLEAGVSPQFTEIEDRAADLLRAEVLDQMASGPDAGVLAAFAEVHSGDDFLKITREIVSHAGDFGFETLGDALAVFGLDPNLSRNRLVSNTFLPDDLELIQSLIPVLERGKATDISAAAKLRGIARLDFAAIEALASVLVFSSGKTPGAPKIGKFPTKDVQGEIAHLMPAVDDLMARVAQAQAERLGLLAAEKSFALHRFAQRFHAAYAEAKQARAWLDFDDLIQRARDLLTDERVAAWVLYRLDGGIDHILVDEAQDTSPAQWDVIRKLAEEFTSGSGARDTERTLFVVGDKKQSIYSFQGADPRAFDEMQAEFAEKMDAVGDHLNASTLDHSFRSSPAILRLVDSVFGPGDDLGFPKDGSHIAFHTDMPGRVDLWPVVPKPETEAPSAWYDPVDRRSPAHQNKVLANAVAQQIKDLIGTPLPEKGGARPIEPRDFLILVQRRSGIFSDIIRACKSHGVPIAGADRLRVGAELAVKDIRALLSFLATPEDSLSLATALRSPLFGWTEQELFALAHHRQEEHLWQSLRTHPDHPETVSILRDLRSQIDFLRPYDLIARLLTRHDGRRKLIARLGTEAEDGIDALLSQALAYERSAIPSLTGFLLWIQADDLEIKRQIDSASNQVRVMTVHGAKGLEAPIVILPECGKRQNKVDDPIISVGGAPVWRTPAPQPEAMKDRIEDMKAAQSEESLRLLYVALTRAETWLIAAAAGELSVNTKDWWHRIAEGMERGGAVSIDTPVGQGLRLSHADWPGAVTVSTEVRTDAPVTLPDHFRRAAPMPVPTHKPIAPSDLGGDKALPGEGRDAASATAFGSLVHTLLERLPTVAPAHRTSWAVPLMEASTLPEADRAAALDEAHRVMDAPDLAWIFAPETLAEVPFVARWNDQVIRGAIDRLVITETSIDIIDFKSNRMVPATAAEVPSGILRQLGAYRHAIAQIHPDKAVRTGILWTATATFMPVPHDIVTRALEGAPYLDGPMART